MHADTEKILAANQDFYEAFAAGDYAALSALWLQSEAVSVIHPGRSALHGRQAVMESWQRILESGGGSDIRCARASAYVHGEYAYVICQEIFPGSRGRLIATNVFIRENGNWRMVHHQAGPDNEGLEQETETGNLVH